MNKQEWQKCTDINKMLNQITDDRKLRLFACASARQGWHLLDDEKSRNAVIVAERFADGKVTLKELNAAGDAARAALRTPASSAAWAARSAAWSAAWHAAYYVTLTAARTTAWYAVYSAIKKKAAIKNQCNLLRDVVNPYYEPILCPKISIEIAQNIYKTQDFTGASILADSLEENGITHQELLEHLRGKNIHVRGCWAIDEIML